MNCSEAEKTGADSSGRLLLPALRREALQVVCRFGDISGCRSSSLDSPSVSLSCKKSSGAKDVLCECFPLGGKYGIPTFDAF